MPWRNGHICVCHPREPWDETTPTHVMVHRSLDWLYGTARQLGDAAPRWRASYEAAKRQFNLDAAVGIVKNIIRPDVLDHTVEEVLASGISRIRVVVPHPAFEEGASDGDPTKGPRNAIPFALGAYLAEQLGCELDSDIEQIARVGRTTLTRWQRFLWQPRFEGEVEHGCGYLIADDVVTVGATFASLRSFIVRSGGTVIGVTALAHKDGVHQRLPVADQTVVDILNLYGEAVEGSWKEAVGHDVQTLTDAEGFFLAEWGRQRERDDRLERGQPLLQRLRESLDRAASKGSE